MQASGSTQQWPQVWEAVGDLAARDAVRRLYEKDATLWSDDPGHRAVAANRLGWLDVADGQPGWSERLAAFTEAVRSDGFERVVLTGMGGSSLAPEVFAGILGGAGLRLDILDSTHPETVHARLSNLDRTLVLVSSKSGGTEETQCFASYAGSQVPSPTHLVAITDPGSALAEQAQAQGWRALFENPPDIGGRYSALSLFGTVPAALAGVDVDEVWRGAGRMREACGPAVEAEWNPAVQLAAFIGGFARAGRDKMTLLSTPELAPLENWIEQLVAESTGKDGKGIVPVVGEPVGEPEVYGDDRAFVVVTLDGQPVEGVDELVAAGFPVLTIDVADVSELGAEFLRWELATALAALLLGVDPFDEPNVTESKRNTQAVLESVLAGETLPEPEEGDVMGLIEEVEPGDYISIQCYLPPSPETHASLEQLRLTLRGETGCATTVGWGPRFLHSTGQLHKGGGDNVVALQLVDAATGGPPIPDRGYDFATLIRAQAVGDLRSLRDHRRRVAQVPIVEREELLALSDAVEEGLGALGPPPAPNG